MKAKDIMTSPVISVDQDTPILQAIRIMLQKRISGLPVVDKSGHLIGIVTESDFLRRAETGTQRRRGRWLEFLAGPGRLADEYAHSHGSKVNEVMTSDPARVTEDTSLEEIVKLMEKRRIKRVPVVRGVFVVGIISRANLLHALATVSRGIKHVEQTDEAIRALLLAELGKQPWAPVALINPIVRNGVVDLWGTITDERERKGLVVAAENVAGVKAVHDHLALIDTTTGMVIFDPDEAPVQVKAS
jgi:CBS domain-containing protein